MFCSKRVSYFACVVTCVVVFNSCVTLKNSSDVGNNISKVLTEQEKFEFEYQFFEGNRYFLQGDLPLATSIFNQCLKIDPTSSASHYKLASIYLQTKDFELAEKQAELAVLYNTDNVWYLYLAGNLYLQNSHFDKAKAAFSKLITINSNELDYYLNLADVYLKQQDLNGAIKIYDNIEDVFGISELIVLQKHKLYMAQNKRKEALTELNKLVNANPDNIDYKRMVADFYIQIKKVDDAVVIYNQILDMKNDGFSHIGLAECYRIKGNLDESVNQLKLAFSADEVQSDVKFNLLLSIIKNGGNDVKLQMAAFELTEILIDKYPDDPDINTIYANFLIQGKEFEKAREILINVAKVRKDKYAIWEQLVLLDNQFLEWSDMFVHSTEALKYFPNQNFLYFFNGFSAFQLGYFDKAVNSLSFGYKLTKKDDPLSKDFLTFLGESYYKVGEKDKCYETFDILLGIDNENIMILNNYAYYLTLDNKNLDKALQMSKITIEKEPNNATYLDTYAWILYMQKDFTEALIFIKKAIDNDSDPSDVVLEHYGDILYSNNKVDEALVQWQKAVNIGPGSGNLHEKIRDEKFVE